MIKSKNITKHATEERAERIAFIATKIGFGEVLKTEECKQNHTLRRFTDTGVIIVTDLTDTTRIVTMFPATLEQAYKFFHTNKLNKNLYNRINQNQKLVEKYFTKKGKKI